MIQITFNLDKTCLKVMKVNCYRQVLDQLKVIRIIGSLLLESLSMSRS
jgi:hypothetical protein